MSCHTKYRYVITGNGMKALVVHSDLNHLKFEELIRQQTRKIHPEGTDTIWSWGTIDFVNPKVHSPADFLDNRMPALIGVN